MNRFLYILFCLLAAYVLHPGSATAANSSISKNNPVFYNQSSATKHPLAVLNGMKHWSNPDYTRISLELDRDVTWESHKLSRDNPEKPARIFVDINHAKLGRNVRDITIGDGLLKGARAAQHKPDVVRVVLDIENIKNFEVFPLSAPPRLIIDVRGSRPVEISRLESTISTNSDPLAALRPDERPSVLDKKYKTQKKSALTRIRRIVIDPGHGGHDSGAVGPTGLQEKNVVLAIGLKLRELLKDELGLDVVMTRSTDVFIPLEERTAIANKLNADLFLSIHANASQNRDASGIETYYLSLAKSEKTAKLAAKENDTSLEKVSVLQAILFDLMGNYKLNDSALFADKVQKSLYKKARTQHYDVRNLGVKQGPFYVLVGATMPSILVETAFVSNPQEEARLRDPAYLNLTAEGILDGVRGYISGLK